MDTVPHPATCVPNPPIISQLATEGTSSQPLPNPKVTTATCGQESTALTSPPIHQESGACYYKPAEAEKKYQNVEQYEDVVQY